MSSFLLHCSMYISIQLEQKILYKFRKSTSQYKTFSVIKWCWTCHDYVFSVATKRQGQTNSKPDDSTQNTCFVFTFAWVRSACIDVYSSGRKGPRKGLCGVVLETQHISWQAKCNRINYMDLRRWNDSAIPEYLTIVFSRKKLWCFGVG